MALSRDEILRIFCVGAEHALTCDLCQETFPGIKCETTRESGEEIYGPCRACLYGYIKDNKLW